MEQQNWFLSFNFMKEFVRSACEFRYIFNLKLIIYSISIYLSIPVWNFHCLSVAIYLSIYPSVKFSLSVCHYLSIYLSIYQQNIHN